MGDGCAAAERDGRGIGIFCSSGMAVLTGGTAELEGGVAVAAASSAAAKAGASPVATVLATDCCESAGVSSKG